MGLKRMLGGGMSWRLQTLGYAVAWVLGLSGCDKEGLCKIGEDAECPSATVCYGGEGAKKGGNGVCTEGEWSPEGKLVATVEAWRLISSGRNREVAPWLWDDRDPLKSLGTHNPNAGWANKGPATIEALVLGLKPGETLQAWTGPDKTRVACEPQGPDETRGELWTCALQEGWAAAEFEAETTAVGLQPGAGAERMRLYRTDTQLPLASLTVGTRCYLGNNSCPEGQRCQAIAGQQLNDWGICQGATAPSSGVDFYACVHTRDMQSGIWHVDVASPVAAKVNEEVVEIGWRKEVEEADLTCYAIRLLSNTPSGSVLLSMEVKAWDNAGNFFDSVVHGSPGRLSCSAQLEGLSSHAVKAPLAFANERLVFGTSAGEGAPAADNSLYFLTPSNCELSSPLHTGALQGPMVTLGGGGWIALALGGGGPPQRSTPRLALVEVAAGAKAPSFVYGSSTDCTPGTGGSHSTAVFDKGLALVSWEYIGGTNTDIWRFAAPANSAQENTSRLMAYTPNVSNAEARCIGSFHDMNEGASKLNAPFTLTPMQRATFTSSLTSTHPLAYTRGLVTTQETSHATAFTLMGQWMFHEGAWNRLAVSTQATLKNPSGIAGGFSDNEEEQIWISGAGLQRIHEPKSTWNTPDEPTVLGEHWPTSPAAIDNEGRAYVVVQTATHSYELQRFAHKAAQGKALPCSVGDNNPCESGQMCMGIGSQDKGTSGLCQGAPEAQHGLPNEAPVGSPLLGHPSASNSPNSAPPSEVYVVTTAGTVLAFHASDLKPLWTQSLGIRISPTAQPVLLGNTLWVVSSNGEVRGIRVDSNGLSRSAQWPKAFHDNCNTSSRRITGENMLQCF